MALNISTQIQFDTHSESCSLLTSFPKISHRSVCSSAVGIGPVTRTVCIHDRALVWFRITMQSVTLSLLLPAIASDAADIPKGPA